MAFQHLQGAVWSCVLNETALVAATGSADFSARVWNALTGDETHNFQHKHIVRTLAFAKRAPHLLTAGKPAAPRPDICRALKILHKLLAVVLARVFCNCTQYARPAMLHHLMSVCTVYG